MLKESVWIEGGLALNRGCVMPVTYKLVLQWLPCKMPVVVSEMDQCYESWSSGWPAVLHGKRSMLHIARTLFNHFFFIPAMPKGTIDLPFYCFLDVEDLSELPATYQEVLPATC